MWMQTEVLRKASNAMKLIRRLWDLITPHSLCLPPGNNTWEGLVGLCYNMHQGHLWVQSEDVLEGCPLLKAESIRTLSKWKIPITQVFEGHFIFPSLCIAIDVLLKEGQKFRSSALSPCNFGESQWDQTFIWEQPVSSGAVTDLSVATLPWVWPPAPVVLSSWKADEQPTNALETMGVCWGGREERKEGREEGREGRRKRKEEEREGGRKGGRGGGKEGQSIREAVLCHAEIKYSV